MVGVAVVVWDEVVVVVAVGVEVKVGVGVVVVVGVMIDAEVFETADWKLTAARNFLSELLGLPIAHFSIAFLTEKGDTGVVATSPRAIYELDAQDIAQRVQLEMDLTGRKIIRKEIVPEMP